MRNKKGVRLREEPREIDYFLSIVSLLFSPSSIFMSNLLPNLSVPWSPFLTPVTCITPVVAFALRAPY